MSYFYQRHQPIMIDQKTQRLINALKYGFPFIGIFYSYCLYQFWPGYVMSLFGLLIDRSFAVLIVIGCVTIYIWLFHVPNIKKNFLRIEYLKKYGEKGFLKLKAKKNLVGEGATFTCEINGYEFLRHIPPTRNSPSDILFQTKVGEKIAIIYNPEKPEDFVYDLEKQ